MAPKAQEPPDCKAELGAVVTECQVQGHLAEAQGNPAAWVLDAPGLELGNPAGLGFLFDGSSDLLDIIQTDA